MSKLQNFDNKTADTIEKTQPCFLKVKGDAKLSKEENETESQSNSSEEGKNEDPLGKENYKGAENCQPQNKCKKTRFNIYASSFIPKATSEEFYTSQQAYRSSLRALYPLFRQKKPQNSNNYHQSTHYSSAADQRLVQQRRSTLPNKPLEGHLASKSKVGLWRECDHPQCQKSRHMALQYASEIGNSGYMASQELSLNIRLPSKKALNPVFMCLNGKLKRIRHDFLTKGRNRITIPSNTWFSGRNTLNYSIERRHSQSLLEDSQIKYYGGMKDHADLQCGAQLNSGSVIGQRIKPSHKTAFKLYKLDHIGKIKEEYPEMPFKARMALLKDMWKQLPPNSKYLYVQRSRLDKKKAYLSYQLADILATQQTLKNIFVADTRNSEPSKDHEEPLPSVIVESLSKTNPSPRAL